MVIDALFLQVSPVIERPLRRRDPGRRGDPGDLDRLAREDIGRDIPRVLTARRPVAGCQADDWCSGP